MIDTQQKREAPSTPDKPNLPRKPSWRWIWWVILAALMVWNVLLFLPAGQSEVSIPYSTFLAQVRADNVVKVHISGAEISGTFAKPFLWPQPTAATWTWKAHPARAVVSPSGCR